MKLAAGGPALAGQEGEEGEAAPALALHRKWRGEAVPVLLMDNKSLLHPEEAPGGRGFEVLEGGTQTTVQDFPGRLGYWAVGMPPSGPMDALSFQLANRLLGNEPAAAGLEITLTGPTLRFHAPAIICLTGAAMTAHLDGEPVAFWQPVPIAAGQTLALGTLTGGGCRTYLAVAGGLETPLYLGSRATFLLGGLGGCEGRALRAGDRLQWAAPVPMQTVEEMPPLPEEARPKYQQEWEIGVLYGPHGAPDYFSVRTIETFFTTTWTVPEHSARTGVRLLGPPPEEAGREGGLHQAYAMGPIVFTDDGPMILGPDGPSLGSWASPACVVRAELWKIGQLRAGDRVRFHPLTESEAVPLAVAQEESIAQQGPLPHTRPTLREQPVCAPVKARLLANPDLPEMVCRAAGDGALLIEYGPPVLDLELRFRVHTLMQWLERRQLPGVIDLTPGLRSIQVHYDPRRLSRAELLACVGEAELELAEHEVLEVASRIVHLPLAWEESSTDKCSEAAQIELLRRCNGLASEEEVKETVFGASYLVMGLGHAYLGGPVAVPLDPRHRLVALKTCVRPDLLEGAVSIGQACLGIHGLDGPGGDTLIGRTLQMWNRGQTAEIATPESPSLLRFFDQIRFYRVSAGELIRLREGFARSGFWSEIELATFSLRQYRSFLRGIAPAAKKFQQRQQAALAAEREQAVGGRECVGLEASTTATPA